MFARIGTLAMMIHFCMSPLAADTEENMSHWRKIPKAELHLHLGGAYPAEYLLSVAEPLLQAELQSEIERLQNGVDYHEAFAIFDSVRKIVNTEERVEGGTEALCRSLESDGVVYAEIRTGLRDFGNGYEEYLKAVLRGIEKGSSDRLLVRLLLSLRRDSSVEYAKMTGALAAKYRNQGVVGIDISGDSTVGEIENILPEILSMKENGFFLTLHLGESPKERGQLKLLEALCPDRVGHGVHLEPEARQWILDHRTPLEVCLTSSVVAQMIEKPSAHPGLEDFRQNHPIAICTDDPLIFQITLSGEYETFFQAAPVSFDEMKLLAANCIDYSFASPEDKRRLKAQVNTPTSDWEVYVEKFVEYYPPGSTKENAQYARILQDDKGGNSTSESMGYAMRMAVQNGDKANFDLFTAFVYKAPNLDSNGLMNWEVNDGGIVQTGSATDADQDIVFALTQAGILWGNPDYTAKATAMAQAILNHEVDLSDTNCPLNGGDQWGGRFNCSYVDPTEWAAFATLDPAHQADWAELTKLALNRIAALAQPLPPNWNDDPNYGYDACRVPMRLAQYYRYLYQLAVPLTPDQEEQQAQIKKILNQALGVFYRNRAPDGGVIAGYTQSGAPQPGIDYSNPAFNSPAWLAIEILDQCGGLDSSLSGVTDADMRTFGQHLQSLIASQLPNNYFNDSLAVLCAGIFATMSD